MLHQLNEVIKSSQKKNFQDKSIWFKHVSNPMGLLGSYN